MIQLTRLKVLKRVYDPVNQLPRCLSEERTAGEIWRPSGFGPAPTPISTFHFYADDSVTSSRAGTPSEAVHTFPPMFITKTVGNLACLQGFYTSPLYFENLTALRRNTRSKSGEQTGFSSFT